MYRVTTIGGVGALADEDPGIGLALDSVRITDRPRALGVGLVVGLLLGALLFRRR